MRSRWVGGGYGIEIHPMQHPTMHNIVSYDFTRERDGCPSQSDTTRKPNKPSVLAEVLPHVRIDSPHLGLS